jgi:hypothetical protein
MDSSVIEYIVSSISTFASLFALLLIFRRRNIGAPAIFLSAATMCMLGFLLMSVCSLLARQGILASIYLISIQLVAAGAWLVGGCMLVNGTHCQPHEQFLLVTSPRSSSTRRHFQTVQPASSDAPAFSLTLHQSMIFWTVLLAALLFVLSIVLTFIVSLLPWPQLDICVATSVHGLLGLFIGVSICAYRRFRFDHRYFLAAVWCNLGVALLVAGYCVCKFWLEPHCLHTDFKLALCPLPSWLSTRAVFDASTCLAVMFIAVGLQFIFLLLEWAFANHNLNNS